MSAATTPSIQQQARLMQVILAPVISEKSTFVADHHRQIVFRVDPRASKPEIKAAVEFMFKVEVQSVKVANVRGKVLHRALEGQRGKARRGVCRRAGLELQMLPTRRATARALKNYCPAMRAKASCPRRRSERAH